MASSRHSPQWLLSGGLCAKIQPQGQQRGTHIICASSPNRSDCRHHLAQRAFRGALSHCPGGQRQIIPAWSSGDHTDTGPPRRPAGAIWLASPWPLQHHSSAGTGSSQEDGGGGHMSCCWAGAGLPSSLLPPDRPEETCYPEVVCPQPVSLAQRRLGNV